jgi:hypothetical protein
MGLSQRQKAFSSIVRSNCINFSLNLMRRYVSQTTPAASSTQEPYFDFAKAEPLQSNDHEEGSELNVEDTISFSEDNSLVEDADPPKTKPLSDRDYQDMLSQGPAFFDDSALQQLESESLFFKFCI